jgi:hypothetical protein
LEPNSFLVLIDPVWDGNVDDALVLQAARKKAAMLDILSMDCEAKHPLDPPQNNQHAG